MHAVAVARSHYETQDWKVEYVGDRRTYDLLCEREGEVLHVEVKGTRSDGYRVVLTRNEEIHARHQYPRVSLFAVSGIELAGTEAKSQATGGQPRVLQPWAIDQGELVPTGFDYPAAEALGLSSCTDSGVGRPGVGGWRRNRARLR